MKLVDDPLLAQRLIAVAVGSCNLRLAVFPVFFESLAPGPQLVERDRACFVGVDEPVDFGPDSTKISAALALAGLVCVEQRSHLGLLRFELGCELLRFLEPSREVLPDDAFDLLRT